MIMLSKFGSYRKGNKTSFISFEFNLMRLYNRRAGTARKKKFICSVIRNKDFHNAPDNAHNDWEENGKKLERKRVEKVLWLQLDSVCLVKRELCPMRYKMCTLLWEKKIFCVPLVSGSNCSSYFVQCIKCELMWMKNGKRSDVQLK